MTRPTPAKTRQPHAWIVTTKVKPPEDWGFKPNWWHDHYYRVVQNKFHATQIFFDFVRLEVEATAKPFHASKYQ